MLAIFIHAKLLNVYTWNLQILNEVITNIKYISAIFSDFRCANLLSFTFFYNPSFFPHQRNVPFHSFSLSLLRDFVRNHKTDISISRESDSRVHHHRL